MQEVWLPGLDSFELATLRLTAEMIKNLSALSGVAYKKIGAILPSLVAPNPAPKTYRSLSVRGLPRVRARTLHPDSCTEANSRIALSWAILFDAVTSAFHIRAR